jgi:hypothetical protein
MWDVFLSYPRRQADQVRPALDALRRHGLRVFVDDAGVAPFASISTTIAGELARSRVLLAWYSREYPLRRACQWELTAAYLAAQHEGDPRRRVLVINPEPTSDHIHPAELRDARHWLGNVDGDDLTLLAGHVAEHVTALPGPLAAIAPAPPPRWFPAPPRLGAARFLGRLPELWQIHSALRPASVLTPRQGTVTLRGPSGAGKTALAEEYALRFSAAYPGGIFWLALDGAGRDGGLRDSLASVASALGIVDSGPVPRLLNRLAATFGERAAPYLWIVDDVPDSLDPAAVRLLAAPHPLGATLLVSTGPDLAATPWVNVAPLPAQDAYQMLVGDHEPVGAAERDAAAALAALTRGLPAAIDAARRSLRARANPSRFAVTLAELGASERLIPTSGALVRRTIQFVSRLGPVSDRERKVAFDIQVELATRVGLQPLGGEDGVLREALTSLYSLFTFIRSRLQDSAEPLPNLEPVAYRLLNDVLRPFLSRWHPRLLAHEQRRPEGTGAREYEQSWTAAPALRADLAELAGPLREMAAELAEISGSDLGLPPVVGSGR